MRQKILCIDFDGVIHSYLSGWKGDTDLPDPPVKGAIEWLTMLVEHEDWDPQIYSSRSKTGCGISAMRAWLKKHGMKKATIDALKFPTQKPPAFLTVDDRCIRFEGTFPSTLEMVCYRPWTAGYVNEIHNMIDKADEATLPIPPDPDADAYDHPNDPRLNKLDAYKHLGWSDIAVTFMQNFDPEGYRIEIEDNDGMIIRSFVYLYEWSGYVTPYINEKNAPGLIQYLIELNRLEERDGYFVREA